MDGPECGENMNVIGNAADAKRTAAKAPDRSADVGVQGLLKVGLYSRRPKFRAEDDVVIQA
jgi:hypothetical protein